MLFGGSSAGSWHAKAIEAPLGRYHTHQNYLFDSLTTCIAPGHRKKLPSVDELCWRPCALSTTLRVWSCIHAGQPLLCVS